ncbi:MAG: hypothetical protein B7Z26_00055 [Asticcacaulis sp. 32-58-5]|nr:MAG: hypothetical protein B7Z26_00055 [Asticcacaulis sp. 32-58-5]
MTRSIFRRNIAWVAEHARADPDLFKRKALNAQASILWIGCSDNLTPALETAAFEDEGCLVHRNLGNQASLHDSNFLATLAYALQLRSLERIVICGHYGCRCLYDVLQEKMQVGTENWLSPITGLFRLNRRQLDAIVSEDAQIQSLCEINVRMQVRKLSEHPLVEARLGVGSLKIEGVMWSARDGLLRDPGIAVGRTAKSSKADRPQRR